MLTSIILELADGQTISVCLTSSHVDVEKMTENNPVIGFSLEYEKREVTKHKKHFLLEPAL